LSKMDPQATWFLHVSGKMLLNGTSKNPTMKPTNLSLSDIIEVLKGI
jgi:histidine triad (HIT) family protein